MNHIKDTIKKILQIFTNNYNLLYKNRINDKILNNYLIEMYLSYVSEGINFTPFCELSINPYYESLKDHNSRQLKIKQRIITTSESYNFNIHKKNMIVCNKSKISSTINNMDKYLEEQISQDIKDFKSKEYNVWIASICKNLKDKYESIDNLFCSENDKLLFTSYILFCNSLTNCKLESYNEPSIKNLLFDFQLIKELQNNIIINNVKIFALENTHIDYREEMEKNNIYDNDNYQSTVYEYIHFIRITKLKETIDKLEEMEYKISNQLEQLINTEINIESIEQYLKLTKMYKDIQNENNDNEKKLSKLKISTNEYIKNRNKFIKKHTYSNQEYFSNLTKLISNILGKPIDLITIDNINTYDDELLQLEKKTKEQQESIILLCKFINDLQIDVDKSNNDNIKIIQSFIKKEKEIELNTNITKNIDIIKQKNEEIQQILTLNKNLDTELTMYNSKLSKFQDEYTIIEKVYNLRKLYSV